LSTKKERKKILINIKKELIIFLALFIVSSVLMHLNSWQTHPIDHLQALFSHVMPYHPFLYVFLIYILIGIIRVMINLLKKLFSRK